MLQVNPFLDIHVYNYTVHAFCSVGELPIEDLMKLYNLERCSATPDTDIEQQEEEEEEGGEEEEEDDEGSLSVMEDREEGGTSSTSDVEMEEEEVEEEPGLELLVSGKSLKEVQVFVYIHTVHAILCTVYVHYIQYVFTCTVSCTDQYTCIWYP